MLNSGAVVGAIEATMDWISAKITKTCCCLGVKDFSLLSIGFLRVTGSVCVCVLLRFVVCVAVLL